MLLTGLQWFHNTLKHELREGDRKYKNENTTYPCTTLTDLHNKSDINLGTLKIFPYLSKRGLLGIPPFADSAMRNVSCQAQMSILLSPPSLLLLLAALVAPATSTTNYRPDWNRLRGLARGRVETCGG